MWASTARFNPLLGNGRVVVCSTDKRVGGVKDSESVEPLEGQSFDQAPQSQKSRWLWILGSAGWIRLTLAQTLNLATGVPEDSLLESTSLIRGLPFLQNQWLRGSDITVHVTI